jgi:hypothetical protein
MPLEQLTMKKLAFLAWFAFCSVALSAYAQPSATINITPGKWADEIDFVGPDSETVQVRKGRLYKNGKDMFAGQLTPAQLRELEENSFTCFTKEEVPTVQQFIEELQFVGKDGDSPAMTNVRILEATAQKARFESTFTTAFLSEKPYSGVNVCSATFSGGTSSVQCEITWTTPPHAGKKSKINYKGMRLGAC